MAREDKLAVKALLKLGIITQDEIEGWLEAVEDLEPEGGLLGLLEAEGRLDPETRKKVERELRSLADRPTGKRPGERTRIMTGKTVRRVKPRDDEAPAEGGEKPAATPGEGQPGVTPEAGDGRADEKTGPRSAPSSKKGRTERRVREKAEPEKKKGGFPAVPVGIGAVLLIALGATAAYFLSGGFGSGGSGDGGGSSQTSGGQGGAGGAPADPSGAAGAGGPAAAPAKIIPPLTLAFKYKEGYQILNQVILETEDSTPGRSFKSVRSVSEFVFCLGALGGNHKLCVERQQGERITRENSTPESTMVKRTDFFVTRPDGSAATERSGGADPLAWVLADIAFPPDGAVKGGAWVLERETADGRFEVRYRVEETSDKASGEDGVARNCVRIAVTAGFPGGAPPALYRLDRAEGRIWFDRNDGVTVKAEAFLDTTPSGQGESGKPAVRRKLTRLLSSFDKINDDEKGWVNTAAALYFGVAEMIENRQYAKALKAVEEADLPRKFVEVRDTTRALIPEVRMTQQAGAAMRDRKARGFRNLSWRRPDRPPAMLTGETPREDGKRRSLPLVGKPAPSWLADQAEKGKPSLVYFAMGALESCLSMTKLASKISRKLRGKAAVKGVILETDMRKLFEYIASLREPLTHQLVLDQKKTALEQGALQGLPAVFVVDAGGTVRYAEIGYFGKTSETEIEEALNR